MTRLYAFSAKWLTSLGLAFWGVSLVLVPSNTLFADTGSFERPGGSGTRAVCQTQCNAPGCVVTPQGTCPRTQDDPTNCKWNVGICNGCQCSKCYIEFGGTICKCRCQTTVYVCDATGQNCTGVPAGP